jgi:hypothetical protein
MTLFFRHPEPGSGSVMETVLLVTEWMLNQIQHDGERDA